MPKRRLSQQQQQRINRARRQRVDQVATGPAQGGLVIAGFGHRVLIEDETGERHSCSLRANMEPLVAGDRVIWQSAEGGGVVDAREPRSSQLRRPDGRGVLRTMAANIDLMLVVVAPSPQPHANLVDRYLVAGAYENIEVALVLNKTDLLADNPDVRTLIENYRALGHSVIETSRESDPAGIALNDAIAGKTVVMVGQSGVGKSSIAKRLLPDRDIKVGALSEAMAKGRHTTTTAQFYHLPGGSALIDSPGIREFQLTHVPESVIEDGFIEFAPYLGHCQFRDCRHEQETGCAIKAAVARGDISPARYESFLAIRRSLSI